VSQTLLPCPFCGHPAESLSETRTIRPGREDVLYRIACTLRECQASTLLWYPETAAIAAWNRCSIQPRIEAIFKNEEEEKNG
jgi:hypothetical protein